MPLPFIAYAGAFVAGQLGGIALGNTIVNRAFPSTPAVYNIAPSTYFDASKELERLGMKNPF